LPVEEEAARKLLKKLLSPNGEEPIPKSKPDPIPEPRPDPIPDPIPEPKSGPDPIPQPEPAPDPIPEPEPEPVPVPIPAARLHVSPDEIAFILELAGIIGDTPRNIQRFVNIYRVIRAHGKVKLSEVFSVEHERIIGLLAIVVGKPYAAAELLRNIDQPGNTSKRLKELLSASVIKSFEKEKLYTLMNSTAKELDEWAPLISRFSFRTVEMMSDEVNEKPL